MSSQLSISIAAGLAQKQLDRNERLNYPEAVAVISNYILKRRVNPRSRQQKSSKALKSC